MAVLFMRVSVWQVIWRTFASHRNWSRGRSARFCGFFPFRSWSHVGSFGFAGNWVYLIVRRTGIHMINLRSVDLNLLPIFEAVYEERNLSSAALRLAMSQPAVSNAVARLRSVFNDELFVRHGRGVFLTPTADAIYAKLHEALGTVRDSVSGARGFDPKTSTRSFFVSVPHPLGPMIALHLRAQLAVAAPGVEMSFSTRSRPVEQEQALLEGRFDATVDWLAPRRSRFNEIALFEDALVAVARQGHPAIRKARTEDELSAWEFVALRRRIEGESPVPALQDWSRLKLNTALEVSEFLEVLVIASQSDLVGVIPQSMLKLARDSFQLRALPAAVTARTIPIMLFWATNKTADPAQVFIRKHIELASRAVMGRNLR
ncbi:LysR family transcriptional regulator [Variovorax sp. J22R133]|uniref:LysR family transcriptional regulator n=1 Tax=Variovorax brevis TaxID=3053503 RepID=UPI002574B424|nr:LysR family transcriptional regulator [Variovorax sp. J22R133]MDM0110797.1 LysR family transcriptional regulator [Variovorax sp. J22R133]